MEAERKKAIEPPLKKREAAEGCWSRKAKAEEDLETERKKAIKPPLKERGEGGSGVTWE